MLLDLRQSSCHLILSIFKLTFLFCGRSTHGLGIPSNGDVKLRYPILQASLPDKQSEADPPPFSVSLENTIANYLVNVSFGSENEVVTMQIDTGSSDTWVFSPTDCNKCQGGTFNVNRSSTAHREKGMSRLEAIYGDGSSASGTFYLDTVTIGGHSIDDTIFAVVDKPSTIQYGILGLGMRGLEFESPTYDTILDKLVAAGVIKSRTFSLSLGDKNSATGTLKFGEGDNGQYTNIMETVPIAKSPDGQPRLTVGWHAFSAVSGNKTFLSINQTLDEVAVLDTGSTLSSMPQPMFDEISAAFNVRKSGPNYFAPCDQPDGNFVFELGDKSGPKRATISVPFQEMVIPGDLTLGGIWSEQCMFGLVPGVHGQVFSFGDTFLRSAYVVVSYDDSTVSFAQRDKGS